MAYIPWYERMAQEKAEREVKKKAPAKQDNVVNKVLEKKPRFQCDPISQEPQDVNAPGWAEKATKQMEDIKKKSLIVPHTETKSPELTGVDRYIRAKKI